MDAGKVWMPSDFSMNEKGMPEWSIKKVTCTPSSAEVFSSILTKVVFVLFFL